MSSVRDGDVHRLPERLRPLIVGCASTELDPAEARLFAELRPCGFILFARNCAEPEQLRALCRDLRAAIGWDAAPILIDQEGGRVARLRPPHWPAIPPAGRIAALWARDRVAGVAAARAAGAAIGATLRPLGIDVDCAPVADVRQPYGHDVIGDRAFGDSPEAVIALAGAFAQGLAGQGVAPMIKHLPGHGRACADSHLELPLVDASAEELANVDLAAFRGLAHLPSAMTAHVVYSAWDAERPATTSPRVIGEIVRGAIGFDGFLVSDDLNMRALAGPLPARGRDAVAAGCDAALHCSGVADEAEAVGAALDWMSPASRERLARLLATTAGGTAMPDEPASSLRLLERLLGAEDR